jgi:cytochrome b561
MMSLLPSDNERLRIMLGHIFGYAVLASVLVLALLIIMKKVEPTTSFGLDMVLGTLAALAGGYANWAYGHRKQSDDGSQQ